MADTIVPGDKILTIRTFNNNIIHDNTIVAFQHNYEKPTVLIKRIVANEGDTIYASHNGFSINEKIYPFDSIITLFVTIDSTHSIDYSNYFNYLINKTYSDHELFIKSSRKYIIVPKEYYFMIGDNSFESMDSRFWGFIHQDQIIGKVVAIF